MKLFTLLKKDLLILVRNQADMAVLFLLPLAFIIPVSLALGRGDGYGINRENQMIRLPVINYDDGPRAQDLLASIGESLFLENTYSVEQIENLGLVEDPECAGLFQSSAPTPEATASLSERTPQAEQTGVSVYLEAASTATPGSTETQPPPTSPACNEKIARAMLQRSQRSAALIIPEGFSASVGAGEQVELTLVYDPAGDSTRFQQIEGVVQGAATRLSVKNKVASGMEQLDNLIVFAPEEIRRTIAEQPTQAPGDLSKPAVNLRKVAPENYRLSGTPDTYQQTIPGYTVMFVFFLIPSLAGSIRLEKLHGTFRRLLSAPISSAEILGGKLLASLLIGLVQVVVLFLIGSLVFHMGLGNDPIAFLLLTIALVLARFARAGGATTHLRAAGLYPLSWLPCWAGACSPSTSCPRSCVQSAISFLIAGR